MVSLDENHPQRCTESGHKITKDRLTHDAHPISEWYWINKVCIMCVEMPPKAIALAGRQTINVIAPLPLQIPRIVVSAIYLLVKQSMFDIYTPAVQVWIMAKWCSSISCHLSIRNIPALNNRVELGHLEMYWIFEKVVEFRYAGRCIDFLSIIIHSQTTTYEITLKCCAIVEY